MGPMGLLDASLCLLIHLQLALGADCKAGECCFQKPPYPVTDSGSQSGPRDLCCYRLGSQSLYQCSWKYEGSEARVSHFLRACGRRGCCYLAAGAATRVQFTDQDGISVLSNTTLWVESRLENRTEKSHSITRKLNDWVLCAPPPPTVRAIRSKGQLLTTWKDLQGDEDVQFRRRTPSRTWEMGDCGAQWDAPSEPCLSTWEKDEAQEIQFRCRKRLKSGALGGPWGDWSDPECIPPATLPLPQARFSEEPLDSKGKRRVTIHGQQPQVELPGGCANDTLLNSSVHLTMLSCCFPDGREKKLTRSRTLELSGSAYHLVMKFKSRFGFGPNQTWHIPAQDPAELRTLGISVEGNVTTLRWAAEDPGKYCVEWQPHGQDRSLANCAPLVEFQHKDPARMANHSWSRASGDLGREACYRIVVFTSPAKKLTPWSWSTVLSAYYYGGNALEAGVPHHVSVRNHSKDSVSMEWTPSVLGACPGVLKQYVVRYQDEDSKQVTERLLPPTQTRVTLRGLRAGAAYTVRVRADSAWGPGAWSRPQRFSVEIQVSHWLTLFVSLGSFASVLLLGVLAYLGLHRAAWHLCPPLPTPCGSAAVQLQGSPSKQTWQWARPGDFPEVVSPEEPFVVELTSDPGDGQGLSPAPAVDCALLPREPPSRPAPAAASG